MRGDPICRKRRAVCCVALALAALAAWVVATAAGCGSPRRRYEVLSLFFDGVPDPDAPPPKGGSARGDRKRPARMVGEFTGSLHPERTCTKCHRGNRSNRLRKPRNEVCFDCHRLASFGGGRAHGPVAAGWCIMCHDPHRTDNAHLLRKPGSQICATCHVEATLTALERHTGDGAAECLRCHRPHTSERPHLLREEAPAP